MKLSTQLTLAIVGVVLVTATAVGFSTFESVEMAILPGELDRTEMRAELFANKIDAFVSAARADVLGLRSTALQSIVRASLNGGATAHDGTMLAQWRAQLAERMAAELAAKPAYSQFRVIGAADNGREIVRVDRSGPNGAIRIVPDDELQRKGSRDYFKNGIDLGPNQVYVSAITLNQENDVIETPHVPTLRVASLVTAPDGAPFGIVIINVDMRAVFDTIRHAATGGQHIYVVNDEGDFLVHPDTAREFGFEFGRSYRWQDEFPGFVAVLGSAVRGMGVIADKADERIGIAMASVQLVQGPRIGVLATIPYAALVASAGAAKRTSLQVGVVAVFAALVLALLVAKSLTGPLVQMTVAAERFSRGEPSQVPTTAGGEIGVLARTFANMLDEVRSKSAALEHEAAAHRRTEAAKDQYADRDRLYGAAVQSSFDAIVTKTLDGVITGWNPAAERMFGFSAAEAIGKSIDIIVPDDRRVELQTLLGRIRRGEVVDHHETVRIAKDGRSIDVSLSISPIKAPSGVITFACKIARDVTDQKLAEEKFRLAVEACPNGIVMTDGAGQIVLVNSEIERLFGYQRGELLGESVDILVPDHLRAQHARRRAEYDTTPEPRHLGAKRYLSGRRKDGTEFSIEVGLNPIRSRGGLLTLCVIADITERNRLDHLKDEFISTVSHELRTPLTSISGSLGLIMGTAAAGLPDSTRRLLSIAHSNSLRLVKLVNDILDVEKLQAGQQGFKFEAVDIRALVEQTVEANLGFADTYLVHLRLDIAADGAVWADPNRLSQALTNLISNAVKFSPPDGEVTVAVERRGAELRISVRDQGAGVPAEFKPRIFQRFAQADATNTKKIPGTGLGLSIVKEIVNRLGGGIGFTDAPGGGTKFYVDLPHWENPARGQRVPPTAEVIKQSA